MAIKRIKKEYSTCTGEFICEYVADFDSDLETLQDGIDGTGSSCVSLESGKIKAVNTERKWVDFGG